MELRVVGDTLPDDLPEYLDDVDRRCDTRDTYLYGNGEGKKKNLPWFRAARACGIGPGGDWVVRFLLCFLLGPSSQISNESLKSDKQGKEDRQSDELQGLDNSIARAACFAMAVLVENPPLLAGPAERTSRAIYALSRAGHVQSRLVAVAWVPTAEKAEGGIPDRARGERASGWALHSTLYGWFGSKVQTTISHPSSGTVVGVAVADLYRPRGTCISSPPRQDSTT